MLCLHVCKRTECIRGALGGQQRVPDSLKLSYSEVSRIVAASGKHSARRAGALSGESLLWPIYCNFFLFVCLRQGLTL